MEWNFNDPPVPDAMPPPVLPSIGDLSMTYVADLKPFMKNVNLKVLIIGIGKKD